jgi:hypothetical protein
MRKAIVVLVASIALLVLGAGPAFATHCSPVNKPIDAGANAGTVALQPSGPPTITPVLNPAGHPTGGFMTVIAPDGTVVASVFKKDLPDGAHNAGPGDNECDGIGIDDLIAC